MTATEPSPAEPEDELLELQSQVGMNFMFLTVLLNHCCHMACMRVVIKNLGRSCLPRKETLHCCCFLWGNLYCIDAGDSFALFQG